MSGRQSPGEMLPFRSGVGVHVRSSPSERRRYTQLLRYSTQEAAREKRPRRSRNELIQGPLSNLRVLKLRVLRWQKGKVFQEWSGDLKFDHLTLECLLLSPLVEQMRFGNESLLLLQWNL